MGIHVQYKWHSVTFQAQIKLSVTEDELSVMRSKVGIETVTTASKCMHSSVFRFVLVLRVYSQLDICYLTQMTLGYDKQNVGKDVVGVA